MNVHFRGNQITSRIIMVKSRNLNLELNCAKIHHAHSARVPRLDGSMMYLLVLGQN
jgi:hypothetical protein